MFNLRQALMGGVATCAVVAVAQPALAEVQAFDIPAQAARTAIPEFGRQSGIQILASQADVGDQQLRAVKGDYEPREALRRMIEGTNLRIASDDGRTVTLTQAPQASGAAGAGAEVEALIVTAQKREEDIQDVPIAISAFTQEALERSQIAGGPDLMTQIPNMTFTKTNFSSYSIQIRGIGTQAISATVDPAVAVAFNNTPFVRNRFFEQEFYDLQRVEVLRGPQGTLYGRNATAGVVNIISQKPRFNYEAKLSGDVANYNSTRVEGMVNIPLVEDQVALRLAGAWTKREGYVTNQLTGNPIDGRDLWSTRLSLRVEPSDAFRANFVYEHFEEDDDRLRSGKQLCHKHVPQQIGEVLVPYQGGLGSAQGTYSQGCIAGSLYSPEAFQTPNGFMLPYYDALGYIGAPITGGDPYVNATQSQDLRVIESTRDPEYRANSHLAQLSLEWDLSSGLTLASETAYSTDELFSTQDFNRFNTKPGAFATSDRAGVLNDGVFCDPQLGCSDRLVLADLSTAESTQFSQELRLSSDYDGPFNFSLGANYLRYDTEDKYYVFANSLTLFAANATWTDGNGVYDGMSVPWIPGVSDNLNCLRSRRPGDHTESQSVNACIYIDPNPMDALNDQGHNYFLSRNPYRLISHAVFGEAYYSITPDVKLTAGLRWTVDRKEAPRIPSWLVVTETIGYPTIEIVRQDWREPTGRLTLDWKPHVSFTNDTLLYASYAHGYKAGGANPPPAVIATYGSEGGDALLESLIAPKTFDPEFIDAFEVGTKNTLLDGRVTFNANAFYYDYKAYQISQIINRSAVNYNFDAEVWGLEIEADWRPLENLRLGFKGGHQRTRLGDGARAIDIMDRTAGDPNWVVAKPFPTVPSNCILPVYFVTAGGQINVPFGTGGQSGPCVVAYFMGFDPATQRPYVPDPTQGHNGPLGPEWDDYPGFDPTTAPNNGEGIFKDLSGNELPNAPHYTATITADYTLPLPSEWLMTLHTDLYYQSEAWTRVFNTEGYDKLKAYTNVNFAAIFTNEDSGWNVMAYVKNVFDRDSITGAFLNSDDTGLTTNVFLTEPRLYGLRVTKRWTGDPILGSLFERTPDQPPRFTVEVGAQVQRHDAPNETMRPGFVNLFDSLEFPLAAQGEDLDWGDGREVRLSYRVDGGWAISARARVGRTNGSSSGMETDSSPGGYLLNGVPGDVYQEHPGNYGATTFVEREEHTIVDFMIGREFGLGGMNSDVSFGVRYARLDSTSGGELWGMPDLYFPPFDNLKYVNEFSKHTATASAEREFEGAGPVISWEASTAFFGDERTGHAALEWGIDGGVLFGRQNTIVALDAQSNYFDAKYALEFWDLVDTQPENLSRPASRSATVPVLGANLGLAYEIRGLKFSGGYRWERYFDAIDGGYAERKSYDRTIDGPYFKLAVGFGG